MFKGLFKKKKAEVNISGKLSKVEYWNKWQLFELFENLHKAEQILNDTACISNSKELLDFRQEYVELLNEIEFDNVADFTTIWQWFSPRNKWETLLQDNNKELVDRIFFITDNWKRNQGFLLGTKVSLSNEFGIVLDKADDWNEYGLIRWDTNKENDIEDWRGLFGSFLQAGGQIINQKHQFNFINEDGTAKKASS